MLWADLPRHPSSRTLREFAGLWLVFFGGLAYWHGLHHDRLALAWLLAGLALALGPLGMVWPQTVRPIFVGWSMLSFPIGWLVSQLTLALLFYLLITPLGVCFRLFRRNVLALRPNPDTASFWEEKVSAHDPRSYLRQF